MRRLAFLDIDGVLNSERWLLEGDRPEVTINGHTQRVGLDRAAVQLLNYLVGLDVEWVLSSTWRGDGTGHLIVSEMLSQLGWQGGLIDSTPALSDVQAAAPKPRVRRRGSRSTSIAVDYSRAAQPSRGDEILAWLERDGVTPEELGRSVRIAILDDDTDLGPLISYRVEVDKSVGITPVNVLEASYLLDRPLVMVDEVRKAVNPRSNAFKRGSAHLTVSGQDDRHIEQLHHFAGQARIRREWFQLAPMHGATEIGHYDVTPGHRERAMARGALFVPEIEQARARRWAKARGIE